MFFTANQEQKQVIDEVVDVLRKGGIILHKSASNRGWTLACDATENGAIQKIIDLKHSIKMGDGFVVTLDEKMQEQFICPIPDFVKNFMRKQTRTVAIAYNQTGQISKRILNPDGTIISTIISSVDEFSVQLPRHVMRLFGKPIFATSATKGIYSNSIPQEIEQIDPNIRAIVDYTSPYVMRADDSTELPMIISYTDDGAIKVLSY